MSGRKVRSRSRPAPGRTRIALRIVDPAWRKDEAALRLIRRAVRLALEAGLPPAGVKNARTLTILLGDDANLRALNARFRRKDKATNVLSFPASGEEPDYLGDVAIAHGVVSREARRQSKTFSSHAAHLAAHGTLHLLGYDHEDAKEARTMESLETAILARLGIADPYGPRPYTRRRKAA